MIFPSSFFKLKARAALKGRWQTALLIALIVNLPTLLVQGVTIFTGNDPLDWLQALVISANRDGVMSRELLLREASVFFRSTGFLACQGLAAAAWLLTPCLSLGMYKWLLDRLHGQDGPVSTVFCRVRSFFKAVGLQLMIILRVLLWALPGAVLVGVGITLALRGQVSGAGSGSALSLIYFLYLPAMAAIVVPAAMAALRYALAEYMLAEAPETGILACMRRSSEWMKGCRKNLFVLLFSFLPWYLLILFFSYSLPGVLSLMIQMLGNLVLSVYLYASLGAFYRSLEGDYASPFPEREPEKDEAALS